MSESSTQPPTQSSSTTHPTAVMHRFSSFESLPTELSHLVCENLDFNDLKKLRLASRTMEAKATFTMEKLYRSKFYKIRLALTQSNLRALEKFADGSLAKYVFRLTLKKTDFETFVQDAKETAQSAETSPWRAAMKPYRRNYKKRLYHEANKWTGKPLHAILPCLNQLRLTTPGLNNEYGPKASISEIILWDCEVIGTLLGNFERRSSMELNIDGFLGCKIEVNENSPMPDVAFWESRGRWEPPLGDPYHTVPGSLDQLEALQSYCQQIELRLCQRPIRILKLWDLRLALPHLQSIFQTASPPRELKLESCLLDFDENLSRLPLPYEWSFPLEAFTNQRNSTSLRPPRLWGPSNLTEQPRFVANRESIEAFVASVRPNLRKLAIHHCKTQPYTSPSSLSHLLETLKSCQDLELVEIEFQEYTFKEQRDGNENSDMFEALFHEQNLDWAAVVAEKGIVGTLDDAIRCVARVRAEWEPR
ncbi:uncharacterized protein J3D65DRAFT_635144 [Phyllosticta citribraziliensis]|uniref:F-box domain-containing protein n=1 Tax=Phyllosticta citribraziliensis TaxID=989973 RepID=A0ABR1LF52_9PEZI